MILFTSKYSHTLTSAWLRIVGTFYPGTSLPKRDGEDARRVCHTTTQARVTLMRFACHVWCASQSPHKWRVIPSKCCIKPAPSHSDACFLFRPFDQHALCGAYLLMLMHVIRTAGHPYAVRCQRYDPSG